MHPGKLSMEVEAKSRKESQEDKKIDFKDILKASSLEDLYNQIINQRLYKLFYASPADYFNYLESTIQVKLKKSTIEDYIEIKATRDLLIHNHGKVNNIYIQKTGDKARTKDTRQTISINEDYFLKSTGVLKMVVRDSYEIATKKYLGKTRKGEMYPPNKPK
ncbi:hypothetical protein [Cyclobacterium amurskyense]|uniref:hypothetical protein n=1 Tax=Cyclobacterium amurskyense TaxID=320787 RepID=UPI0030D713E7|tara:strand:- start:2674 stop:3159 length:486 start_codon:yes stop_codon:yes gene_type:complete